MGYAEPYPIFYKYRERRRKDKATNFIFIRISSILNDSKYGDVNIGYCEYGSRIVGVVVNQRDIAIVIKESF